MLPNVHMTSHKRRSPKASYSHSIVPGGFEVMS